MERFQSGESSERLFSELRPLTCRDHHEDLLSTTTYRVSQHSIYHPDHIVCLRSHVCIHNHKSGHHNNKLSSDNQHNNDSSGSDNRSAISTNCAHNDHHSPNSDDNIHPDDYTTAHHRGTCHSSSDSLQYATTAEHDH